MNDYKILFSTNAEIDLNNIQLYYQKIDPKIAYNFITSLKNS